MDTSPTIRMTIAPEHHGQPLRELVIAPLAGAYPDIYASAEQIIYEDDDLLALNKPAGVYVDSTPWDAEGNYHAALVRFIAARDGVAPTLHLAHRLDRDTTGVLLVTKNRR